MSYFKDNPKLLKLENDSDNNSELLVAEYSSGSESFKADSEFSHYENMRLQNIEENKKQMAVILGDTVGECSKSLPKEKHLETRLKKSRRSTKTKSYQLLRRSGRIPKTCYKYQEGFLTMGSKKQLEIIRQIIEDETADRNKKILVSKEYAWESDKDGNFKGWFKTYKKEKTPTFRSPRKLQNITDEDLKKVAIKGSVKIKHPDGTTCHQCRQKTLDLKTICRLSECIGVRGQFCGICLQNRYGESAIEAILNPIWSCPPCRDICNCSICRNKIGLSPTGVLYPKSKAEGFKSVHDCLHATEESEDSD